MVPIAPAASRSVRLSLFVAVGVLLHLSVAWGQAPPVFLQITAGKYTLGTDDNTWDERPSHSVRLSHSIHMGVRPVSNADYEAFDPSHRKFRGKDGTPLEDDAPVRFVSWIQANEYCGWLSDRTKSSIRLPTEAEWEAAFMRYHEKLELGREVENWCSDWYGPYVAGPQTDPPGYASGEFRVVRGGSWAAPKKGQGNRPAHLPRFGALPSEANAVIGFRVVEGAAPAGRFLTDRPVPVWARDVSQSRWNWAPPVDMARPFFGEPVEYVRLPPPAEGPVFAKHDHDPALVACPNGDLLAIFISCESEAGREMVVAATRLEQGATKWSEADLFWDTPGRNDTGPALWSDEQGTLYHFNGMGEVGGWDNLATIFRKSQDNGVTWTASQFVDAEHRHGNQPIASVFQGSDGVIYLPCDASPKGWGGTVLHVSRDGGRSFEPLDRSAGKPNFRQGGHGAWIAGIHAGVAQWKDGSLVAIGRGDDINRHMTMSVSRDGGKSWNYFETPFPAIGRGQRAVLRRLKEGPLLFISFTPGSPFRDEKGRVFTGEGMFAALSYDGGKTWPVARLLSDGVARQLDGHGWTGKFAMDATHAEPMGYLTAIQTPDGMIHLISSGVYYHFNLAWIERRS